MEFNRSISLSFVGRSTRMRTSPIESNLQWVKEYVRSLSRDQKDFFEENYGKICTLPFMYVEIPLIKALMAFWNWKFHCFTFGDVDIAPTLEEYRGLLHFLIRVLESITFHMKGESH